MKKRIPLFFFIDMAVLSVKSQKELVKWFRETTRNNSRTYEDSYNFSTNEDSGNRYIGFINRNFESEKFLGARQSYDEYDFLPWGSKKVTYDLWKKYIKNKKYTAVQYKLNDTGEALAYSGYGPWNINKDTIQVVKLKRNQICIPYLKSKTVMKALEGNKNLRTINKEGLFFSKRDVEHYRYVGNSLKGETEGESFLVDDDYYIKKVFLQAGVRRKVFFKCQHSNKYSRYSNRTKLIVEDGTEMWASKSFVRGTPRSSRDGLIFITRIAATNYGYASCEVTGDWLPAAEARKEPNARYKALARKWKCPQNTQTTVGFEIEKEDNEAYEIGYSNLYDTTDWCKENDSSVNGPGGYELVTPVYNLFSKDLDNDIENNEDLQKLIDADYSENCGGHINISSQTYSPIQLVQGFRGFLPLLYSIWSLRITNRYCPADKPHVYRDKGKYSALHVKSGVLELRLASAVKSVKNLLWRRDLIRIMIENINKSELEVLRMMLSKRSKLHRHLRKVYNPKQFEKKCDDFVRFTARFNDIKLKEIDWDSIEASKYDTQQTVEED